MNIMNIMNIGRTLSPSRAKTRRPLAAAALFALLLAALTLLPAVALAQTPPASVTLARADGTVTASWPQVSNAAGYHITYSSDNTQSWTAAPCGNNCTESNNGITVSEGVASITISGLDNHKIYIVGVRASDNGGQWSEWTNSAPIAPQLPAAPGPA